MKKPMIKALAMTMAITMALSTPLTASAAGLADLYRTAAGNESGNETSDGTNNPGDPDTSNPGDPGDTSNPGDPGDTSNPGDPGDTSNPGDPGTSNPGTVGPGTINAPDVEGETDGKVTVMGIVLDQNAYEIPVGGKVVVSPTVLVDTSTANISGRSTTLSINADNIELYEELTVVVFDANGRAMEVPVYDLLKHVAWEVGEQEYVTYKKEADNSLTLTGKSGGTTYVKATIRGKNYRYEAKADVKVTAYTTSIKLKAPANNFVKHQIKLENLIDERLPKEANDAITWKVYETGKLGKNTSYASIKDDILTLKKATPSGKSITVIATTEQGATGSTTFTIGAGNPITKLKVDGNNKLELTITKDKEEPDKDISVLIDKTKTSGTTTDFITWTSKNPNIVDVEPAVKDTKEDTATPLFGESKGAKIIARSAGKTTITATATSGQKATFTVTVKAPVQEITGIKVVGRGNTVYLGQKVQLEADVLPKNADPKEIKKIKFALADTNDKQYATVSAKGVVQANKKGIITEDNKTVNVKATYGGTVNFIQSDFIKVAAGNIYDFALNPGVIPAFYVNQQTNLKITNEVLKDSHGLEPDAGMYIWATNKPKVVTVDQNGHIEAVAPGSANITATTYYMDGNKLKTVKKTTKVTVKQPVEAIQLNKTDVTVNYNQTTVDKNKDYSVTLKVSKRLPKNADKKEVVRWKVISVNNNTDNSTIEASGVKVNDKGKVTIPAAKNPRGTVIKVQAQSALGAKAVATITVCDATKNVTIEPKKADLVIKVPKNQDSAKSDGPARYRLDYSDDYTQGFKVNTKTESVCPEKIVSYTANNNNIRIAKESDGHYYAYALKAGKSVVTAKTASGKPAKITFTITEE